MTVLVGGLTALVYFVASRGFNNFYPFSVYDMYRSAASKSASRVVAIDEGGRQRELTDYDRFACSPARPELSATIDARCETRSYQRIPYVERDLQVYLDEHLAKHAAPGAALTIVWRGWTLEDKAGPPASADCVLARCTAQRLRD